MERNVQPGDWDTGGRFGLQDEVLRVSGSFTEDMIRVRLQLGLHELTAAMSSLSRRVKALEILAGAQQEEGHDAGVQGLASGARRLSQALPGIRSARARRRALQDYFREVDERNSVRGTRDPAARALLMECLTKLMGTCKTTTGRGDATLETREVNKETVNILPEESGKGDRTICARSSDARVDHHRTRASIDEASLVKSRSPSVKASLRIDDSEKTLPKLIATTCTTERKNSPGETGSLDCQSQMVGVIKAATGRDKSCICCVNEPARAGPAAPCTRDCARTDEDKAKLDVDVTSKVDELDDMPWIDERNEAASLLLQAERCTREAEELPGGPDCSNTTQTCTQRACKEGSYPECARVTREAEDVRSLSPIRSSLVISSCVHPDSGTRSLVGRREGHVLVKNSSRLVGATDPVEQTSYSIRNCCCESDSRNAPAESKTRSSSERDGADVPVGDDEVAERGGDHQRRALTAEQGTSKERGDALRGMDVHGFFDLGPLQGGDSGYIKAMRRPCVEHLPSSGVRPTAQPPMSPPHAASNCEYSDGGMSAQRDDRRLLSVPSPELHKGTAPLLDEIMALPLTDGLRNDFISSLRRHIATYNSRGGTEDDGFGDVDQSTSVQLLFNSYK